MEDTKTAAARPSKRAARRSAQPRSAGPMHEECLSVLDRLGWPGHGSSRPITTLGVTSCRRGEGVSTMAAHLAVTAASYETGRVLLVDCNLAQPALPRMFGVDAGPGLIEWLLQGEPGDEFLQESGFADLWILAAGNLRGSPARAYESPRLPELIGDLAGQFDLTIFDMPPAGQASCTGRLAGMLDGVLLVVEAERVRWEAAWRVKELLVRSEAQLLGAVLNKRRERTPEWM